MDKTIFIGGIYPEEIMADFEKTKGGCRDIPADTLQKNIIKGIEFNTNEHITVFSSSFLDDTGLTPEKVGLYTWSCDDGGVNYNLPYVRMKGYMHFSKINSIKKYVMKWIKENNPNGKTKVVVYSAYFAFLLPLISIKKKYDIEVCLVVADLPQYMGLQEKRTFYQKYILNVTMALFNKGLSVVDKFVLLTEKMNEYVNRTGKPYTVMEGIASELYEYKNLEVGKSPRVVIYSGRLQKKYGIPTLLEATKLVKDENVEFRFYGNGDAEELINEYATEDNRIKYCSILSINEIHDEQQKATILINTRQNNEVFTKFSFPSKNLEYMLSGRPTIAYMLDGIPKEYENYLIVPFDETPKALADCITNILNKSDAEQSEIGMKARNFVLENKNYIIQTKKIVDLLNL